MQFWFFMCSCVKQTEGRCSHKFEADEDEWFFFVHFRQESYYPSPTYICVKAHRESVVAPALRTCEFIESI